MTIRIRLLAVLLFFAWFAHAQKKLPSMVVSEDKLLPYGSFFSGYTFHKGVVVVEEGSRFGLKNAKGEWVVSPTYEYISKYSGEEGFFPFKKDGLYGFLNAQGKVAIPAKYKSVNDFTNGYAFVIERLGADGNKPDNEPTIMIDTTGKEVTRFDSPCLWVGDNGLFAAFKNKKWGYRNLKGEWVIEAKFESAFQFYHNRATIKQNGLYYLIDGTGKILSEGYKDLSFTGNNDRYRFSNDNQLYGAIDSTGKVIIQPEYRYICTKGSPVGVRDKNGRYYYIDAQTGKQLWNKEFSDLTPFVNGVALVIDKVRLYAIDAGGKQISEAIDGIYSLSEFSDGLAWVRPYRFQKLFDRNNKEAGVFRIDNLVDVIMLNSDYAYYAVLGDYNSSRRNYDTLWGVLNRNMQPIIPATYKTIKYLGNHRFAVLRPDNGWQVVDKTNKVLLNNRTFYSVNRKQSGLYTVVTTAPYKTEFVNEKGESLPVNLEKYSFVRELCNNRALVYIKATKKYGYIDSTGVEVIPAEFDFAANFVGDLAPVSLSGKWGVINKKGEKLVPTAMEDVWCDSMNIIRYKNNGKWGLMKAGKIVLQPTYESIGQLSNGLMAVKSGQLWGYINMEGKEVVPCKYKTASIFMDGIATVSTGSDINVIDLKGKELLPASHLHTEIGLFCGGRFTSTAAGNYMVLKDPRLK